MGETLTVNVAYGANKQVTLSGQLTGTMGPVANQTVNLGGSVSGTATTNGQGNYSVTLTASKLGQVTAVSADGQSNTATAMLATMVPTISNFDAICEGGGVWEITGNVMGMSQGEVVNLGGIAVLDGKSTNVNPNGSFTLFVQIESGSGGTATAQAVDWWGDASAVATTSVPV